MRLPRRIVRPLLCALCAGLFLFPSQALAVFNIAWMSDTQLYCDTYHDSFYAMTEWVAAQQADLNIRLVLHTGDIVSASRSDEQWQIAADALGRLGSVPYLATSGNHDLGRKYQYDKYNAYIPTTSIGPLAGGFTADGRSRYVRLSEEGRDYIFISMGMGPHGPYPEDVEWANRLLKTYSDHIAVLITHSFLYARGGMTGHGNKIFESVIEPNPNVWLVLCGHCRGVNRRSMEIDDDGDGTPERTVYAVLGNYQDAPKGGGGYIRMLMFGPDEVAFSSYSPVLNDYNFYDKPGVDSFTIPLP